MSTLRGTSLEGPVLAKTIGTAKLLAIAGGLVLAAAVGYAINSTETKTVGGAVVSQSQTADFLYWNTTALDRLVPVVDQSSTRGDNFTSINTIEPVRLVSSGGRSSVRGDAFISVNTIGLEYPAAPYTERWNGPR